MMKIQSPAKFSSDYTKLPSKEPTPKNSFLVNWETLFVDKETDFLDPSSSQTIEEIPMKKYDSHSVKPAEIIFTKDASTNTYTVLTADGSKSDSDSEDEHEKRIKKKRHPHPLWESEEEEEKPKMNGWIQFYLGSLSVVGLFIFFRMMRKSK